MTAFRRLALGFPIGWSHRRAYSFVRTPNAGSGPYFIEWDPGHGVYGEDWCSTAVDGSGVPLSGQTKAYHPIRIAQFALNRFGVWHSSGDRTALGDFLALENAAQRWTAYIDSTVCRGRVIGAALRSLPERLAGCDTISGGART